MSVNVEKAVQFINNHGNNFQLNYFRSLFGANNLGVTLQKLGEYQNTDGGWIQVDPDYTGNISSVLCTMAAFGKFERLKIEDSNLIDSSISYLEGVQKSTGAWDESDQIIDFDPPYWYYPRITNNRIWFTNSMLRYIVSRRPKEKEMIMNARNYIRPFWNGQKIQGYDHNNWMGIVSFYNGDNQIDHEIWNGCMENIRRQIRGYDLADVVWTLESCYFLNLTQTEEVVATGIELLLSGQGEDGGFCTQYGALQRADVTIEALDTLANYGVIPRGQDILSGE